MTKVEEGKNKDLRKCDKVDKRDDGHLHMTIRTPIEDTQQITLNAKSTVTRFTTRAEEYMQLLSWHSHGKKT